ncbi:zinc finger and BTB domain-containing protein 7C [Corythoichthys intestinalis]|uniref:zinc finger and BTB domain-containing protein 7C n=1 Tax=Corythoichthys intestinalis TaxID=161448 RepID=UPI0025A5BA9F|nr:zinc finger and BTB domain-containing protein 7C [Corythoichthys intestinalis]XP_057675750.1 zinc finger and BTB domain-containing protein 7C [Corythoichthys intestinalis]XP_057675751.1 zinc finger and BTB domain-containing protein 7C [Corythoichthys intestinalis]XP_057675752.1 zinc finger and BTB domain-containing protein 7C [Corythoichthys intestinalis]
MVHHREEDRIGIPFPNHSSDVLCSLNEQRRDGLLCDVVLIARDQEYRSHRSVLAACSHYFKKLFTVANGEDGRHHHAAAPTPSAAIYEIDFVAPESLTAILEFAYTSTLTVTTANVSEILNAAQMLEIPCIINVCLEIMDSGGEGGGGSEGRGEEEVEEDEEDEDGSRNDDQEFDDDRSSESRGEPLGMDDSPPPSTSAHQEGSPHSMHGKQESPENRSLKDFSIESLLQDGLYPRISALDRRASFSPLLPGFYPSMWAADFPAFPQHLLDPGLHQHSHMGSGSSRVPAAYPASDAPLSGPLDLAVKREVIKEEMKEEVIPGLLHGNLLKDFVSSGLCGATRSVPSSGHTLDVVKDEADFRSYLSFLNSASHLGALFPPWQLEEERKMKPKSSQQCPICNKIIQGAGKLPRHMRTHTGEKPYMCTICEVRFTRQDKLKIHMRKHTGERPYICLHCNSKFVHNYDLKNHLRIHTGVRPYQCEHCYKSFTRSDHLHRHLKRQSCRVSRPRRGRKPTTWRSAPGTGYLCPPNTAATAGVLEENGFKSYQDGEEKDRAERQRGVFAFALAGDDVLARSPFYVPASDPWTVRLECAPPVPETAT